MTATAAPAYRALAVTLGGDGPTYPAVVELGDGSQPLTDSGLGWRGDPVPRWNGWIAEPLFDRATVERIAAECADINARYGAESDYLEWDGDTVILRNPQYEREGWTPERIAPRVIDGTPRWSIGAYSWTWAETGSEDR